jgi:hypothetical protein
MNIKIQEEYNIEDLQKGLLLPDEIIVITPFESDEPINIYTRIFTPTEIRIESHDSEQEWSACFTYDEHFNYEKSVFINIKPFDIEIIKGDKVNE